MAPERWPAATSGYSRTSIIFPIVFFVALVRLYIYLVIQSLVQTMVISEKMLDLVVRRFRTLGEPYRLRLLQELESGEKTINELVDALAGNQPNVSKHLQILHDAGLVARRRARTSIFYAMCDPMVFKLCDLVCCSESKKSKLEFEGLTGRSGSGAKY